MVKCLFSTFPPIASKEWLHAPGPPCTNIHGAPLPATLRYNATLSVVTIVLSFSLFAGSIWWPKTPLHEKTRQTISNNGILSWNNRKYPICFCRSFLPTNNAFINVKLHIIVYKYIIQKRKIYVFTTPLLSIDSM